MKALDLLLGGDFSAAPCGEHNAIRCQVIVTRCQFIANDLCLSVRVQFVAICLVMVVHSLLIVCFCNSVANLLSSIL